jgi:hypothetical protein
METWLYCFFNIGARWKWMANATPRPLFLRARNTIPFVQNDFVLVVGHKNKSLLYRVNGGRCVLPVSTAVCSASVKHAASSPSAMFPRRSCCNGKLCSAHFRFGGKALWESNVPMKLDHQRKIYTDSRYLLLLCGLAENNGTSTEWRSAGRPSKMAAPDRLRTLKHSQLVIEFPFVCPNNSKYVDCSRQYFFV